MATTSTRTKTINRKELVGVSSVAWIRPMRVQFSVVDTKPNTVLYPFFDGIDVSKYVNAGAQIKSDSAGRVFGYFDIPGFTFNTGSREFKLQENSVYERNDNAGSVFGSAKATFQTSGVANSFREVVDTFNDTTFFKVTNIISPTLPPSVGPQDPLAQSFFTYGLSGGCFITGIELFFQSKDASIPVRVEIRELVNGTPGSNLACPYSFVSLSPTTVNVSADASAATLFRFPSPVYLPENKDWCFVILSNSNSYNVWTSKIGEKSQETGKTIFEQPFIGSMFKSENNITWTAEQSEDIKFKIYKAKFNTSQPGSITLKANSKPVLISGDNISATTGSSEIVVEFSNQHGLRTNDYINIVAQTGGSYRGIPSANLTSSTNTDFPVTVIDDYKIKFFAKSSATSTGTLSVNGIINDVVVDNGGSGYPVGTTITFSDPPVGGTAAQATVVLVNGVIVKIDITNAGSGYTSIPSYTLSFVPANPASLVVISKSVFEVTTNAIAHGYKPSIVSAITPETEILTRIKTTDSNYQISNYETTRLNSFKTTGKHGIVISEKNNGLYLPSQNPTEVNLTLSSSNPNTTPVLALKEQKKIQTFAYVINNFPSYDEEIVDVLPGSGDSTSVYFRTSDSTEWIWNGTGWIQITNSEFQPSGGGAYSKYITKQVSLEAISKGARIYVTAASMLECNFDLYIRTSLSSSSTDHRKLRWKKMKCDAPQRNLSKSIDEFFDYTFYLDDIDPFNIYDMKIVFLSSNKAIVPRISNYRVIILAT